MGLFWTKSTFCADKMCVEVAQLDDDLIAVRDSKDVSQPYLTFSRAEWTSFLNDLADGSFQLR